jgi:hypothetical protein
MFCAIFVQRIREFTELGARRRADEADIHSLSSFRPARISGKRQKKSCEPVNITSQVVDLDGVPSQNNNFSLQPSPI